MIRRADLFRLVASLVADELGVQRGKPIEPSAHLAWTEATRLDDEPAPDGSLGFDSLARIDVSGRLNQFFHLHETGVEDYLLTQKTLGGLVDVVTAALKLKHDSLTFQTSGSTGVPTNCTHAVAALAEEVAHLATLLAPVRRIVALVPAHHIYGYLFTVALPEALGADVVDARLWGPSRLLRELGKGDALVATPHLWAYLQRSLPKLPAGLIGVTSTAPMPDALKADLAEAGLGELIEVYGSSETAGIGARRSGEADFALFPHWRAAGDGIARILPDGTASDPVMLMDRLDWRDDRHFRPAGRIDGAVQIGGVNVFPGRVAAILREHPLVAECAVRVTHLGGDQARARLKAFIVPRDAGDEDGLIAAIENHAKERLAPLERPAMWQCGPALPRSEMGKLIDW